MESFALKLEPTGLPRVAASRYGQPRVTPSALPRLSLWLAVVILLVGSVRATEKGATVFPVLTELQPHPGQTVIYNYNCFYAADEMDGANGKKLPIDFHVRVMATEFKIAHNWGLRFLGGTVDSQVAVPLIYQQLHAPQAGSAFRHTKYSISNVDLIPFSVTYNNGIAHWYYEVDMYAPAGGFSKTDQLNIGLHNMAIGPVAGITLLPNKGKTQISSLVTYIVNGYDNATHYHSGNEFFTEFSVYQSLTKRVAAGVNGAIYRQTTDDYQYGARVGDGFRGRDLQIGPQLRFLIGRRGGIAFKYSRDTLVQNKPRGNAFWFQLGLAFPPLSKH
jgi:hypothetical protein